MWTCRVQTLMEWSSITCTWTWMESFTLAFILRARYAFTFLIFFSLSIAMFFISFRFIYRKKRKNLAQEEVSWTNFKIDCFREREREILVWRWQFGSFLAKFTISFTRRTLQIDWSHINNMINESSNYRYIFLRYCV